VGHSPALDASVWSLPPNSPRGCPRDCSPLGVRLAIEVLFIGHDGHHSISLTNSPNGGLQCPPPSSAACVLVLCWTAQRVHKIGRRSTDSLPFGGCFANGHAFSNASYFPHLGNGVMSWTHSCYSSAFRFSDESGRRTTSLNSISKTSFESFRRSSSMSSVNLSPARMRTMDRIAASRTE